MTPSSLSVASGRVKQRLPEVLLAVLAVALLVAPAGLLRRGAGDGDLLPSGSAGAVTAAEPEGYTAATCGPVTFVPGDSPGACHTPLLRALYTGLVRWDPATGAAELDLAAEIRTEDQRTFTIRLEEGHTFHDGSPVTAAAFAAAWNHTAYGPNALALAPLFEHIEGYDALRCGEPGCTPAARELSGVEILDDRTLRVRLRAPDREFVTALGSPAFFPLPDTFFADPGAFALRPIGNGPFRADGEQGDEAAVRLVAHDAHPEPPAADRVEFRVYDDRGRALDDVVAGNLDVAAEVPPGRLADARAALGDRLVEGPGPVVNYLGFAPGDPRFADADARRAVSMALDRTALVAARPGERPATGFLPPGVPGARPDACSPACAHDPAAARALFGAAPFDGPVELHYNSGAGHEAWVEAAAGQLSAALGVEVVPRPTSLDQLIGGLESGTFTGLFRIGWFAEYPSPGTYLRPRFAHPGPEVTGLLDEAAAAPTAGAAVAAYQAAEDRLVQDLPLVPVFFSRAVLVHSERVHGVAGAPLTAFDPAAVSVRP